eukprot:193917-Prymnesium_polylepis.1
MECSSDGWGGALSRLDRAQRAFSFGGEASVLSWCGRPETGRQAAAAFRCGVRAFLVATGVWTGTPSNSGQFVRLPRRLVKHAPAL